MPPKAQDLPKGPNAGEPTRRVGPAEARFPERTTGQRVGAGEWFAAVTQHGPAVTVAFRGAWC